MRIVVATYNIHGCIGLDGKRDPHRIARVIHSLGADVVALQEVEAWPMEGSDGMQIDCIASLTGVHAIHGPTMKRDAGHYGNALLTRLPVLDVQQLSIAVDGRQPRGALDVLLDAAGARLRVIATHLGLRPNERRKQVRMLLDVVSRESQHHHDFIVLLGDFNEWFIVGRPLRWLHRHFGSSPARRTWPSPLPFLALDRIWVHPKTALRRCAVHSSSDSRKASDHLPICAELSLELAPSAPEPYGDEPERDALSGEL